MPRCRSSPLSLSSPVRPPPSLRFPILLMAPDQVRRRSGSQELKVHHHPDYAHSSSASIHRSKMQITPSQPNSGFEFTSYFEASAVSLVGPSGGLPILPGARLTPSSSGPPFRRRKTALYRTRGPSRLVGARTQTRGAPSWTALLRSDLPTCHCGRGFPPGYRELRILDNGRRAALLVG